MTRKSHYCFGDFRLLKMGGKQRNPMPGRPRKLDVVYGAEIRYFAELNMIRKSRYCLVIVHCRRWGADFGGEWAL
jgi:hypothetical protein